MQTGSQLTPPVTSLREESPRDLPLYLAKHIDRVQELRERVWQLQDRQFQTQQLEVLTRDFASGYYAKHPAAIQTINQHLDHIFAGGGIERVYGAPRRINELLASTPCVFTFFPGLGTHNSISQYSLVLTDRFTYVTSRRQISLGTNLSNSPDSYSSSPIVLANMAAVTGEENAEMMIDRGMKPVFHRFRRPLNPADCDSENPTVQTQAEADAEKLRWADKFGSKAYFSCGATEESLDFAKQLIVRGVSGICVDIAIGNSLLAAAAILELKEFIRQGGYETQLIAGNVDTDEGYYILALAGADVIKVGIGPGSACTTRKVTRAGAGQGAALMDVARAKFIMGPGAPAIWADGGVESAADVLVGAALGASGVMVGKRGAITMESSALKKEIDGETHAFYYGSASLIARRMNGGLKEGTVGEGDGRWIRVQQTFDQLMQEMHGGLTNALSYYNSPTLDALRSKFDIRQQLCDLILGVRTGIYIADGNFKHEAGTRLS
jgi:GMP reductase